MRTLLLAAFLGLAMLPTGAFADPWKDESGKGGKEFWKKQEEFQKEQWKREREYWKEREKRERKFENDAWERHRDRRDFVDDYGHRREYRHYAPQPRHDYYDDRDYVPEPPRYEYYEEEQPRLKGRGQIGPYRFEVWE
jgi:hypothetical protein